MASSYDDELWELVPEELVELEPDAPLPLADSSLDLSRRRDGVRPAGRQPAPVNFIRPGEPAPSDGEPNPDPSALA